MPHPPEPAEPASPRRHGSHHRDGNRRHSSTNRHSTNRHSTSHRDSDTEGRHRRNSQSTRQPTTRRESGTRSRRNSDAVPHTPRSPQEGRRSRRNSNTEPNRPRRESNAGHRESSSGNHHQHSHHHRRNSTRRSSASYSTPVRINPPPLAFEGADKEKPEAYIRAMPSPGTMNEDQDPMLETGSAVKRKKSLIRPERRRKNSEDPNYYYRVAARDMEIMPSTTGVDPQMEEDITTVSSDTVNEKKEGDAMLDRSRSKRGTVKSKSGSKREPNKLTRKGTVASKPMSKEERILEKRRRKAAEHRPPTLWGTYCSLITFWAPGPILKCFGFKNKSQQHAWREKMGLISIILLVATFVGFLTFGFTEVVCPSGGPARLRVNHVGLGYMIFHGKAYDLTKSHHPQTRTISAGGNVLWDMDEPHGGQDGSFLFQNVNGNCKGLITAAQGSDVPTNSDGDLAWYFPCQTFNQDGSTQPNKSIPYYLGYSCHTQKDARQQFYGLHSSGDVYFTWDDIRNTTRNLMVYSGDVLDLDLLEWFNSSQVAIPSQFEEIRRDSNIRGKDMTLTFSHGQNKQIAQCLQEITKVGSIDTETVGCIASKVVLYVSLIFILGIVAIKFFLALLFQWFLCKTYAASKTSMGPDMKKRRKQIEDWTDDIYRPPPKMADPSSVALMANKRNSFLPTTSRFTSPYAIEKLHAKTRPPPTTMASQSSTSRLLPGSNSGGVYMQLNRSEGTLPTYMEMDSQGGKFSGEGHLSTTEGSASATQRFSSVMHTEPTTDSSGPQGFIHDAVVPQPPPEWQPFGFPLAHAINLVTCYSEGPEGIRTTLDSIAMTDYPNSHKLLFVVCDGLIKGKGETLSTPEACLSMLKDPAVLPDEVQAFSYVAVASGSKRHNMAKVYAGFYDYGPDSVVPLEKQQRTPMIIVVKCGTPEEASAAKPGNRGKRDSQIILMSFLQKVMFDERMTELEYQMFNGIWKITGISPDFYEIVLMVDADTKVFPDSLTHMISAMVKDPEIMGLCGETKIANKTASWVSMIQVFEYFISHHQAKSFESVFGGVTCLPGCFCMYRIKAPKGGQNYWVPILANPDIVEHYSENVVETLHEKNLLLLGEDRYLSTLMLKTFPKRKQVFVPQAVCKTTVPDEFKVLLSQRRRWINSTVHNLMELVLVRDLCGTFCFSMQFVVFIELVGTLVLPAAISFTVYVCALGIKAAITHTTAPTIPLILLALILGLPGFLIVLTAHRVSYVGWMFIYLLSLPVWNLVLPVYAFWHFDDFSWGDTRQTAGAVKGADKNGHGDEGEFDSSKVVMKRWVDFEQERRLRSAGMTGSSRYYAGGERGDFEDVNLEKGGSMTSGTAVSGSGWSPSAPPSARTLFDDSPKRSSVRGPGRRGSQRLYEKKYDEKRYDEF